MSVGSPGGREELLATELPTLIVQGGADPFGQPSDFPPLPPRMEIVEVPEANHTFNGRLGSRRALRTITDAVVHWLERQQI
jgi:hypothetical protein